MKLPPLRSIEAFESAAKHLNFTRAGEELNITSAAVSQRIASLEVILGHQLFERNGPKLKLTELGEICRPVLIRSLMQSRSAVVSLQEMAQNRALAIKTSPSFTQKWLISRLGSFNNKHPDIDLRALTSTNRIGIEDDELCMAIFYGIDHAKGLSDRLGIEPLFKEHVFPVCSPDYATRHTKEIADQNLNKLTLIHDDTMKPMQSFPNWRRWCDRFGFRNIDTHRGPRYSISSIAIQAAIEGQGIVLARSALVQDDINAGKLIIPFKDTYPLSFEYYFVYPKIMSQQPNFILFRNWLITEAHDFSENFED